MPTGLLQDLKVVEWGNFISAAYCAKLLADIGAQVTKVEAPRTGDELRQIGPFFPGAEGPEASAFFLYLNTNKESVTLDVTTEEGRELLHGLLDGADFFIENHTPAEMKALGLDYASLKQRHPNLIVVSITAFGQTGPYRDYVGSDLISFQTGGFGNGCPGAVTDPANERPLRAGGHQADFLSGLYGAAGAMHGLFHRNLNNEGVQIDVSGQEAIASIMYGQVAGYTADGAFTKRGAEDAINTRLTPCQDGWFMTNLGDDRYWANWVGVMGNPEWAESDLFNSREARRANLPLARPHIEEWTMQHSKVDIHLAAQGARVPVLPTNNIDEVVASPQYQAREYFVEAANTSGRKVKVPGAPYSFSKTPWSLRTDAPALGEHTDQVLTERLHLDPARVAELRARGVI